VEVWRDDGILVRGIGVPHANVPTIGYRIDVDDVSIAFSSDQNGSDPAFVDFIQGVDVLVIHMTANENVTGFGAQLHAKPSIWGQMARRGAAGRVLVSHIGAPSMQALRPSLDILRENYSGPVTVGEDLMCVAVSSED
jgi:ribonuclease BN (tRNA processing enzyme)